MKEINAKVLKSSSWYVTYMMMNNNKKYASYFQSP